MGFDQERAERLAPPFVAAGGERAQRVAVIALLARDDAPALRLAGLDEILPRHLQRGFHRFRAAADEIDAAEAARRVRDKSVGEALGGFAREEAGVGVGERVELRVQRGEHVRMAVPQAGHRRAAARVDVAPPVVVEYLDSLAADGHGREAVGGAVEQTGHLMGLAVAGRQEG